MQPDTELLKSLVTTRMPFGKYKGLLMCDLPDAYLVWFQQKGYPKGKIGLQLQSVYEIKANGVGKILQDLKKVIGVR